MDRITRRDLGRFLSAHRVYQGETPEDVATRIALCHANDNLDLSWLVSDRPVSETTIRAALLRLEAGNDERQNPNFECLANYYGFHPLFLDPYKSEPIVGVGLEVELGKECIVSKLDPKSDKCVYSTPDARLSDTDAMIARVVFGPNSCSDRHFHLGDEFVMVLKGSIELEFSHTGARVILDAGHYCHFWAEQPHVSRNRSSTENAEVFVIRFLQLTGSSTRSLLAKDLDRFRSLVNSSNPPANSVREVRKTRSLLHSIAPWLQQLTHLPSVGNEVFKPSVLLDPVGLGQLLRQCPDFRVKSLTSRVSQMGLNLSKHDLWAIGRGEHVGKVTFDHLMAIAKWIKIPPALFATYFYPKIPSLVVIRQPFGPRVEQTQQSTCTDFSAFEDLHELRVDHGQDVGRYLQPIRTLAGSDISLSLLVLPKRTSSIQNHHPSFELLLPLKGRFEVEVHDKQFRANCFENGTGLKVVHYRSHYLHKIINATDEEAAALIIRFAEYHKTESGRKRKVKNMGSTPTHRRKTTV